MSLSVFIANVVIITNGISIYVFTININDHNKRSIKKIHICYKEFLNKLVTSSR